MQRGVIDGAKGMIFQTIPENIDIHSPPSNPSNAFWIADFGSSTGPNTFVAMQNIIDAVMLKNQSTDQTDPTSTTPEFQVFFNDYIDNDFNTLFKTLPPNRLYFAAGVPGSFHNQLFPRASLHIAHCSYALHWLSRIPPGVTDRGSPAWNKDKIYCAGNKKEVTEAYFGQFQEDMDAFLEARAQELVEGGLVVIQIPGVPDCKWNGGRVHSGGMVIVMGDGGGRVMVVTDGQVLSLGQLRILQSLLFLGKRANVMKIVDPRCHRTTLKPFRMSKFVAPRKFLLTKKKRKEIEEIEMSLRANPSARQSLSAEFCLYRLFSARQILCAEFCLYRLFSAFLREEIILK
ncbi:hypothetical protein RHMOL_Rhmol04G0114700 [Rhododendron molle]|uniref:Uncharacterized protein n=1 Tax=Rhododendron molle TaxID=49168 RepID=A0ACC0P0W4_RHOML|nr:hypothetical protein RHMOL_Rhmol04G0114700 [Rhododendron molle]